MRTLSVAFGLLMVAAAAVGTRGPSLVVVAVAVAAVVVAIRVTAAATVSVGCSVVLIVLTDPPPIVAALAGLSAAAYLVLRHTAQVEESLAWPTVAGAVGLSAVGMTAALVPTDVPWLPLVAPVAVLAVYAIVTRPFVPGRTDPP
jgi:hypothetical protein